jgi:4-aminobutyrate aminotransferase-like enzyme
VCKSAHAKINTPDNDYLRISEKPAWELLHRWVRISPVKAMHEFRKAAGFPPKKQADIHNVVVQRRKHISESLSLSYREPIMMEKAAFQYMYDDRGNTFLDARNNISHVGHCHPRVISAGARMMHQLNTNTRYVYQDLNDYAERLIGKFPSSLSKIFFVNSGSAASDLAIRLASAHTNKQKILVMEQGYHGNTSTGIDISHYKFAGKGGSGQREHIIIAPIFDFNIEKLLQKLKADEGGISALIAEPIIGCGGQIPLPEGYLNELYPYIRKQGGVCISDEVQTGFGRLGKTFWGFELYDVVPDIVILGKPMGNGHPLAAVVTTEDIVHSFENGMEFFSSFGGNPVSCAIGMAVLDVIEEEKLQENALETGNYLKNKLNSLKTMHPCIADVRGEGLYLGVELVWDAGNIQQAGELTAQVCNGLRQGMIMVGTDGPHENVLKIKPPLCFSKENANELVAALEEVLGSL